MEERSKSELSKGMVMIVVLSAVICLCVCCMEGWAAYTVQDVRLPHIFGDNMVLQAGDATPVWGWAKPGQKVFVTLGNQTQSATADKDGRWKVILRNLEPTDNPVTLTVKGKNTIQFKNVLVGDVWLGSGQSNMDWGVGGVINADKEIAAADYPKIRLFIVPIVGKGQPRSDCGGEWVVCSPSTVPGFSAVLYFFGREIHQRTGKPVGLIRSSVGGTAIEPWTPASAFPEFPDPAGIAEQVKKAESEYRAQLPSKLADVEAWVVETRKALKIGKPVPETPDWPEPSSQGPTTLFNGMISPLIPYGIKGIIWYQGESNGSEGDTYFQKMQALIGSWRKLWGRGNFPFYFVQLANWLEPNQNPEGGDGWARCREAQLKSLSIPNTGMAVTIDIGEANDIHPKNKQDVGRRLALWALNRDYGMKDIVPSGPLYKSMKIEGDRIRISFEYVGSGLIVGSKKGLEPVQEVKNGKLNRFAIAGADRKWHWAEAEIDGDTVVVHSPEVPNPVAVRYAFAMNPEGCNLYNREGLPASPFRTDDW